MTIDVETGFFERWWIQQSNTTQAKFAQLVKNGQLEFINGGTPSDTAALSVLKRR